MGYINGCLTVNGGVIETINGVQVEILSHHFHNPHCNIVCTYFMEGSDKVEVTYYRHLDGSDGMEVYRFRGRDELQHHYSRNYTKQSEIPKKYIEVLNKLMQVYQLINFDSYLGRHNS